MKIEFRKRKEGTSVMVCTRQDGSTTWSANKMDFFILHDLTHYVVETILAYREGFYGLVAAGFNIQDFEIEKSKRPERLKTENLPAEAIWAEYIVSLIQSEQAQNEKDDNFIATLRKTLHDREIAYPEGFEQAQLEEIREKVQQSYDQWAKLNEGESLYFDF